jgi:hypothetical protein
MASMSAGMWLAMAHVQANIEWTNVDVQMKKRSADAQLTRLDRPPAGGINKAPSAAAANRPLWAPTVDQHRDIDPAVMSSSMLVYDPSQP